MPTLIEANRGICGEFQVEVGMPAGSALRYPCRHRHGNRFLLVAVKRSKLLPFGGALADQELDRLKANLAAALTHARNCGELSFDGDARER